jgi:hypothetical protein
MVRCLRRLVIAVCALMLWSAPLWAQPAPQGRPTVASRERYSGPVTIEVRRAAGDTALTTAKTRTVSPTVHYQVLSLPPGTKAAPAAAPALAPANLLALPLKAPGGFVVYELRAGKLTTVIDGNRKERREGEFWLVRPGETIVLETEDDSVVVQTIEIPDR